MDIFENGKPGALVRTYTHARSIGKNGGGKGEDTRVLALKKNTPTGPIVYHTLTHAMKLHLDSQEYVFHHKTEPARKRTRTEHFLNPFL